MSMDDSMFTLLNKSEERNIYVSNEFSLNIVAQGEVSYRHGKHFNVYHVQNLNVNLLYVYQLT
jgi:hypothetical protein